MKIAMYSTSELFGNRITGGLKRFLELYYGLRDKGCKVELYSRDSLYIMEDNGIIGYSLNQIKDNNGHFFPAEVRIMIKNYTLLRNIKRAGYNKIIVFDIPTAFSLSIMGIKNIQLFIRQDLVEYRSIAFELTNNKIIKKIYLYILLIVEHLCLIKAEKLVIQCQYDLNNLMCRHPKIKKDIYNKSTIQINNVNPSWIIEDSISAAQLDVSSEKIKIGFVGDFSSNRKGHILLLPVLKRLIDEGQNIEAYIIGDGKMLDEYKQKYLNYNTIIFTGRLLKPISLIKYCNICIVPSLADSCPNTVMEALYNNILVVGSRAGGIPEILNNPEWLFELNEDSLYSRIIKVLNKETYIEIKKQQKIRKEELFFDWSEKIYDILM